MTSIYNNAEWRAFRLRILDRDLWTCQMCGVLLREGKRDKRSAVVDHLIPVVLREDLFLEPRNVRACCKRCHDTVCSSIERRYPGDAKEILRRKVAHRAVGLDGYPIQLDKVEWGDPAALGDLLL